MVIQKNKIVIYIAAAKSFYNSSTFLVTILPKKKKKKNLYVHRNTFSRNMRYEYLSLNVIKDFWSWIFMIQSIC